LEQGSDGEKTASRPEVFVQRMPQKALRYPRVKKELKISADFG